MKLRYIVMALALITAVSPAHARKQHFSSVDPGCNVIFPCAGIIDHPRGVRIVKAMRGFGTAKKVYERQSYNRGSVIGGRPSGCPHAYCGCSASLYLFGKIIPHLNLAANWLGFPRTAPAPRMAAARRGHVMVLVSHVQGDTWVVHDGNSGGHQTRLHERSIRGYSIVNPNT